MRRYLIAGNWKMNTTLALANELASAIVAGVAERPDVADVLVCPPYPYLLAVRDRIGDGRVSLGAQDAYFESPGAFTGEVATQMLTDVGCSHVILGHSERRHVLGETNELINRKVKACLSDKLIVVLCVGELLDERKAGRTETVVEEQLAGGLANIATDDLQRVVIAYEPVWAIGTGVTASPEQAEAAHGHIRAWLSTHYDAATADRMQILYGGSVKPDNADILLSQTNVDGALIGGASLKADSFLAIYDAAGRV